MVNLGSELSFRRTWQNYPENLFLFSLDILNVGLRICQEAKMSVVTELFVRAFLKGEKCPDEIKRLSEGELPGVLEQFLWKFPGPRYSPDELDCELWTASDDFSKCCQASVRRRFQRLFAADGIIPVFLDGGEEASEGFLVPFEFGSDREAAGVFDLSGQEIPEWSDHARQLGISMPIRIHCHCVNGLTLSGASMMLPLQLAWWRRNHELPQYNVFRVVATGKLDAQMHLAPVETVVKAQSISEKLQDSLFLFPETPGPQPVKSAWSLPLRCGTDLKSILRQVQRKVEALERLDPAYVLRRLAAFDHEVRLENHGDWDNQLERLRNALVFTGQKNPVGYLTVLLLLAEGHCHAGRTKEAMEYNAQARKFALNMGPDLARLAIRAEIDYLVLLQDVGKFSETVQLGEAMMPHLEELGDMDLWMRFHGTLGQAQMYGAVQGTANCVPELARRHFEEAVKYAEMLGSDEELAQDLNYLHLWFAFFRPATSEEEQAWLNAYNHNCGIGEQHSENHKKNLGYLKRAQVLAWYRHLLEKGCVPVKFRPDGEFKMILAENFSAPWIKVCIAKCLGALEAARGNRGAAELWFRKMRMAIPEENHPSIVTLICAAGLAEAYHTLDDDADRRQALRLLERLEAVKDDLGELPTTIAQYRDFLTRKGKFPAKNFWY